jgi:glyoxylase-like metal-dependent hydrolase (beta-lactamase superfamily II)
MSAPQELTPGLWRWTARHPEWHPGAFGAEVASFALLAGDDLLLIDPLVPADGDEPGVLERLDALAGDARAVHVLITIPYHVRSAEPLRERFAGARIWGPPKAASRLTDTAAFTALGPGAPGPAGAQAFVIGRPERTERPLWLPSHGALAFGDALVGTPEGELRVWSQKPLDEDRVDWYRDTFNPTLAPLRGLPADRVLVTHGEPVITDGATALAAALDAPPWYHHG